MTPTLHKGMRVRITRTTPIHHTQTVWTGTIVTAPSHGGFMFAKDGGEVTGMVTDDEFRDYVARCWSWSGATQATEILQEPW